MQFIGAPLLGRLSDQYGRKPILLISQLGTFIGFIVLGLANALPLLFIARIIDGLSGANISTAQAVISDSTNERTRTQGLGLLGAAFGLGFVIGPVIAFLALHFTNQDYHAPAFVAAFFSALSIVLTWFWLEETHGPEKRQTDQRQGRVFVWLAFQGAGPSGRWLAAVAHVFSANCLRRLRADSGAVHPQSAGHERVQQCDPVCIRRHHRGDRAGRFDRQVEPQVGRSQTDLLGLATLALGMALTALTPAQTLPGYSKAGLTAELTQNDQFPNTRITCDGGLAGVDSQRTVIAGWAASPGCWSR